MKSIMLNDEIIDKIRGCLYGQAIGDALGLGTEAMSKYDVCKHYSGSLTRYDNFYQDERRAGWPIGMWTDDTEMMLAILECIVESSNSDTYISPKSLASYFLTFYEKWGFTCGILTRKVLNFAPPVYEHDPIKVSKLVWELKGKNNAPNGGLMRTSIIGLWPFHVEKNAVDVCRMTHYDPRCVCSCLIASIIIYNLVWRNKNLELEELYNISRNFDNECQEWIFSAHSKWDISELNLDDEKTSAYTYRTLSCALWAFFHATSFEDGLLKVVNEGGDADTNAAIACAILGAKFGYSSIPSYYIDNLYNRDVFENKISSFINKIEHNITS